MLVLALFAIVAFVILFQLYSVLGRKSGFRVEDKVLAQKPDDYDGAIKLERPAEGPKLPNLDLLKSRDSNFNEINFVEKARETYEQVVLAFHKGDLTPIRDRLASHVADSFSKAISARAAAPTDALSFVDTPKADLDVIDFKDDMAQIRVRFLSELVYEGVLPPEPETPLEAVEAAPEAEAAPVKKTRSKKAAPEPKAAAKPEKIYKRTAEYWTFQKAMRNPNTPWLLTRVEAAKA
ncbi:MAG TPA: Tim44/TimA family putative adaptor protein [Asticcacaulis sp.]|nr:Tim44/TimA family putative adaptor protein [Asticcacaulis sp.]